MKTQKLKQGDIIVIKPIFQLLEEGWEPIVWGWIKNSSEINYYHGVERTLRESRTLTVCKDDGGSEGIHCFETPYHIAREVIGMVLKRQRVA